MPKSFLKIIIVLVCSFGYSQNNNEYNTGYYQNTALSDIQNVINNKETNNSYEQYDGTPYLKKEFSIGTINNLTTDKSHKLLIRFNIFKDRMEIQKDKNSIFQLSKQPTLNIELDNKKFFLKEYEWESKTRISYLEILLKKDKIELFKKRSVILKSAVKAKSSYEKDKPAKFISFNHLLYKSKNQKITSLPKKKKEFFNIFQQQSEKVYLFAKKNKLSFKKESDLIKIFEYFNSLI